VYCVREARHGHCSRTSAEASLLMGAADIGLSLVAACSAIAPDWDRMLLVGPPPGRFNPSR